VRAPDTANGGREDNGRVLVIAVTANVSGQPVIGYYGARMVSVCLSISVLRLLFGSLLLRGAVSLFIFFVFGRML
jgi:hypothetical protein